MSKNAKPITYKSIPAPPGKSGETALAIYPPGAWMGDDNVFHVFVGGVGVGTKPTLAAAKRLLVKRALEYCLRQIDEADKISEHYGAESIRLSSFGLGSKGKVNASLSPDKRTSE